MGNVWVVQVNWLWGGSWGDSWCLISERRCSVKDGVATDDGEIWFVKTSDQWEADTAEASDDQSKWRGTASYIPFILA